MNEQKNFEPEIDFKNLLHNPKRLIGIIFPLFFVLILFTGIYFLFKMEKMSFNNIPVIFRDSTNIKTELEIKKGGEFPAVDLNLIKIPTPEFIAKGKESYSKNCISCHGDAGLGNGVAGANLNPKPRNFSLNTGWTNGSEFNKMFKTLKEGILKNGMAAYEYLPADERIALIHYIRTLGTHFPAVTDQEIKEMDLTYKLSQKILTPNQIPTILSEKIMTREYSSDLKHIDSVLKADMSESAVLLKSIFKNPSVIIKSMQNDSLKQDLTKLKKMVFQLNRTNDQLTVNHLEEEKWNKLFIYLNTFRLKQ